MDDLRQRFTLDRLVMIVDLELLQLDDIRTLRRIKSAFFPRASCHADVAANLERALEGDSFAVNCHNGLRWLHANVNIHFLRSIKGQSFRRHAESLHLGSVIVRSNYLAR